MPVRKGEISVGYEWWRQWDSGSRSGRSGIRTNRAKRPAPTLVMPTLWTLSSWSPRRAPSWSLSSSLTDSWATSCRRRYRPSTTPPRTLGGWRPTGGSCSGPRCTALGVGVDRAEQVLGELEQKVQTMLDIRRQTIIHKDGTISGPAASSKPKPTSPDKPATLIEQTAALPALSLCFAGTTFTSADSDDDSAVLTYLRRRDGRGHHPGPGPWASPARGKRPARPTPR